MQLLCAKYNAAQLLFKIVLQVQFSCIKHTILFTFTEDIVQQVMNIGPYLRSGVSLRKTVVSQWWILGGEKEELTTCPCKGYVTGQRFIPKPELCRRNRGYSQLRKANYLQTSSVKVESTSTKTTRYSANIFSNSTINS